MQNYPVLTSGSFSRSHVLFLLLLTVTAMTHERTGSACQVGTNFSSVGQRTFACSTSDSPVGVALLALQWTRTLRTAETPSNPESMPIVLSSANESWSAAQVNASKALLAGTVITSIANGVLPSRYLPPSFSLAGAVLTGSIKPPVELGPNGVGANASTPSSQEQFEPFGYPGAGLLLELHMPEVTLQELHTSTRNSLAQFLLEVREALGKASSVDEARISILGIHGRYRRTDMDRLFHIPSGRVGHVSMPSNTDEEVIVRFEILPGWAEEPDPRKAMRDLQDQLQNSQSPLMQGSLGGVLKQATISLSTPVRGLPRTHERRGMGHVSALAWPIGISAAFIGVLVWLAAY